MADVLAIAGAGTTALLGVAVVIVVYKLIDAVTSERASMAAEVLAEKAQQSAEIQRDAALADAKKAREERDVALARLATTEKQRNDAQGEKRAESKDAASSVVGLNDRLSELMPLDDSGGAGDAAGADHGHAGQDAVPPAGDPEAAGVRRGPAA